MKPEQIEEIERLVNDAIIANHDVAKYERSLDEAKRAGVTALFGEKYGDRVRVVDIAGFSRELCGGTHVERAGDIGPFKVVEEGSVQAGVRRITALTGPGAVEWMLKTARTLRDLGRELAAPEEKIPERVRDLQAKLKEAKAAAKGKAPAAAAVSGGDAKGARREARIGSVLVHLEVHDGAGQDELRARWDQLKGRAPVAAILVGTTADKVALVAGTSKDVASPGFKAGIGAAAKDAGGRAGGRPDMVQGGLGGKDQVDAFMTQVEKALGDLLSAKA